MKLVSRFRQKAGRLSAVEVGFLGASFAMLAAIELLGRSSQTDLADLAALCLLGLLGALTALIHHRRHPLWTAAFLGRVCRGWTWFLPMRTIQLGVDLRKTPPIPHGVPRRWLVQIVAFAGVSALLAVAARHFPHAARELLVGRFYLGYLLMLGVLWGIITAAIVLTAVIAWAALHDWCVESYRGDGLRPIRREAQATCGLFLVILVAAFLLPRWFPAVWFAALFAVHCGAQLLGSRGLILLWKDRRGGPVRSFDGRLWLWGQGVLPLFLLASVIVLSRGDSFFPSAEVRRPGTLPLTSALGEVLIWTSLAGLTAWTLVILRYAMVGIVCHPERPPAPIAWIEGAVAREDFRRVAGWLRGEGWQLRTGRPPAGRICVPLRIEAAADSPKEASRSGDGTESAEPLTVSATSRPTLEIMERLRRRDEIQCRRALKRGLEMLFKRAARRPRGRGAGFWIGLQHWFIRGLARDESRSDETDREATWLNDVLGPPFHRVFPKRARSHFHQIASALEVDLIFLEDGVGYRRFARVLSMMFEVYDVFGGRQRAEERHFTGLPGVRVVLHDFTLEGSTSHGRDRYPEPDYEELGRARILHVFRDRGESDEKLTAPIDTEGMPLVSTF